MQRNMSKTSIDDLPSGLVADILSRLPVKTLIQSTCVRKVWYSLIKSPHFISLHFTRSRLNPSNYIFLVNHYMYSDLIFGLIPDDPRVESCFPTKFGVYFKNGDYQKGFEIIGSCNGLVCLANNERRDVYLLNPFICKYKELDLELESSCFYADLGLESSRYDPETGEEVDCGFIVPFDIGISFGYCETDDDYKELRIIRVDKYSFLFKKRKRGRYYYHVEIYSLKSEQWEIVDVSKEIELFVSGKSICVHGCLYWCIEQGKHAYLLCFSLKDEVFSKIELPITYHKLLRTRYDTIVSRNDSLVVVLYEEATPKKKTKVTLLVMEKKLDGHVQWKESSYKCASISVEDDLSYSSRGSDDSESDSDEASLLSPLGFSSDGRLIFNVPRQLEDSKHRAIVSVDLNNSRPMEVFSYHVASTDVSIDGITNVLETLALLSDGIAG